jgi:zinc/manganese transport system permease protein
MRGADRSRLIGTAMYDLLFGPFVEFEFLRRALAGTTALALGAGPIGVFLMLRRMSLVGDAMAHAILPGAAIGFLLFGLSLVPMTVGALAAGLMVALAAGVGSRSTVLHEDASLAAFYLISLALGVLVISLKGSAVDLVHVLFGSVLALDDPALVLLAGTATVTVFTLAVLFRALAAECVDAVYLSVVRGPGTAVHLAFLALVVLNLVAGFQALGTLLAVGIMMLPAAAARFWARRLIGLIAVAVLIALAASVAGLIVSYQWSLASGPAITLAAGLAYLVSVLVGPVSGALWRLIPGRQRIVEEGRSPL